MGNSATKRRKKNIPLVQPKRDSILDILTARTGRQDFSTAQTPAEDIIIKCNLEEMTKSFFQDYVIVWHDPNVNSQENQQYIRQLKKFCDVFTFTEWQKARDYIQSTHAACHVVTSGTNGELLVKEISGHQSVTNIYIFCRSKDYHVNWAKNYSKVSCIETHIEKIVLQIQFNLSEWYKQASSLKLNLPAFAPIFNDGDKSQMNNLHRFLKVIPNFKNRLQAKIDFLNLSKAIYSDPKNTKLIADFEQNYNEYDKEQTLRWYSQESFLYKMTNNCLRIATSDSIQYCRLLLQDIQKAIKEQYQTESKNFNRLLYRGAYLSQEEWASLKANLNREIEMHGFLSVSKVKSIGLNFMKADPSRKVFITIIVPKGPNEEEQGFAEMGEFSEYPQEKEVLFNVRSRFTILETEDEYSQDLPYRHLVLLYGAQGFRKFLTDRNPILEVSTMDLTSCDRCKVTPDQMFFLSLNESPPEQLFCFCNNCLDHNFGPFLCVPVTRKIKTTIRGCLLTNSYNTDLPFYGYECSKCQAKKQRQYFLCTDCNEKLCKSCFEKAYDCMNGHNVILETHPFSFWVQGMSEIELEHFEFQNDLVIRNNDDLFQQAEMYFESQLYEKAIEYYSAYIQQNEAKGSDSNLADSYQRLGLVFDRQGEYNKALECYFKSNGIQKSLSGECHPIVAASYASIGLTYNNQEEYKKALEYSLKALGIAKLLFEDNSLEIAHFYMSIGRVYSFQGEYKKALGYYLKCLDIYISAYGENHPDVSYCSNYIGMVYNDQGEYKKALEYYFKSLDAYKAVYGDNHPEIAITYNLIGLAFNSQGEYKKAHEYYFKALETVKFIYGEKHPILVTCYNQIGSLYNNLGEYKKAMECYFKCLDIGKSVYGDSHPDIINIYNNIGVIYNSQGEYKKALEYHLKSLDIAKSAFGENHQNVALSYNNIGFFYYNQRKYKEALEYYFKSIEIKKSVFGDNHPEIAHTYRDIGLVFQQQGEDRKAFEYFSKSRDIFKSLYGENHSKTIEAQGRMFEVQSLD